MTAPARDLSRPADPVTARARAHPWWVMGILGIAELMVTLDGSIVNIALPSAQADLGFSDAVRPWAVTSYALAFGSLLLLGGRVCDLIGRRRALLISLVGFAAASVLGGLAPDFAVLVTARALQGAFAALLAPSALSLLTTAFPDGRARARAFGVFATLATAGASLGMVLGGVLTEYLGWRWCMYVNALFAAVAFVGGLLLLPRASTAARPRLDIPGVVTAAAGLFLVVYGFANAETQSWTSTRVAGFLAAGVVVLAGFVVLQRRSRSPLLPLGIVLDRRRGGAFLTPFVALIGMFAVILFLTYVLQRQLGFSPVSTGVAFLPLTAGIMVTANLVPTVLLPRTGPGPLIAAGLLSCAGALSWLSFLTVESSYVTDVLGPLLLMGLGLGAAIATAINTATVGIAPADVGVAAALVNTVQQVGGSVGLALLSSIAAGVAAAQPGERTGVAELSGYTTAFTVAAAIFVVAAIVIGVLIPTRRAE